MVEVSTFRELVDALKAHESPITIKEPIKLPAGATLQGFDDDGRVIIRG